MVIKWTPWNVPMHRRLEVFWASFAVFVALFLGPISVLVIAYILVTFYIQHTKNADYLFSHCFLFWWNLVGWQYLFEGYLYFIFGIHLLWSWRRWYRRPRNGVCFKSNTCKLFSWHFSDIYYHIHGGRSCSVKWAREIDGWHHYLRYFPIDLIKTADLPADRHYIICLFPHGVLW